MGRRRARRKFSAEYKAEVVELIRTSGRSISAIAKEMDLTETCVREWVRQAEVDAGRGPKGALTTAEREELTKLRQENRTLRMEREILRKAAAFFAKENA
jgi:transposase-like protein